MTIVVTLVTAAAALLLFLPGSAAAPAGLRVAIYSGTGAESDKILAMFRAVQAAGDKPLAVTKSDLVHGRLLRQNFDVFIIPAGEDGKKCCSGHYADIDSLDQVATKDAIRAYLNGGGGVVAEEAGAFFASSNGGTLDIYAGSYTWTQPTPGSTTLTIVDPIFGGGTQQAWRSFGGGYFSVPSGATQVARDDQGRAVIVRASYGAGRVVLGSFCLELRGDSELDWTIWDNWAMGGVHQNSAGAWSLLGRMIGWAARGDASAPSVPPLFNRTGHRIAVVATHTSDGGAWPGLLPAVARAIEFSGHVPLAIRFQEIQDGRLALSSFKVANFPGGYGYGYKLGLAGHEQKIRDFIAAGGGYYGICAGSFYAPATIVWLGRSYDYPLAIYHGQDIGPVDDIAPWPQYALTPVQVSADPVIGNLGRIQQMYYGGGYHTIPSDGAQGAHVTVSATFGYGGSAAGQPVVVRFPYGAGHVLMTTTHPEARAGSDEDWLYWDGFADDSTTPLFNPDNPWIFVKAAFDNWLSGPPPPVGCGDPPDMDLDGRGDVCDCAPADPSAFAIPPELSALRIDADKTTVRWSSAAPAAGAGTTYDLLRGSLIGFPVGSSLSETCVAAALSGISMTDSAVPGPGSGFYYEARARNACGLGTYGIASSGAVRVSARCP